MKAMILKRLNRLLILSILLFFTGCKLNTNTIEQETQKDVLTFNTIENDIYDLFEKSIFDISLFEINLPENWTVNSTIVDEYTHVTFKNDEGLVDVAFLTETPKIQYDIHYDTNDENKHFLSFDIYIDIESENIGIQKVMIYSGVISDSIKNASDYANAIICSNEAFFVAGKQMYINSNAS